MTTGRTTRTPMAHEPTAVGGEGLTAGTACSLLSRGRGHLYWRTIEAFPNRGHIAVVIAEELG